MRSLTALSLLLVASSSVAVEVFRRDTPVDIESPKFSATTLPPGNPTEALYYDAEEEYLVLQRQGQYYQMCDVPARLLKQWQNEDYSVTFYTNKIQLKYECDDKVPSY